MRARAQRHIGQLNGCARATLYFAGKQLVRGSVELLPTAADDAFCPNVMIPSRQLTGGGTDL